MTCCTLQAWVHETQLITQLGNKAQSWKPSVIVLSGEVSSTAWEFTCPQWRVILTFKAMPPSSWSRYMKKCPFVFTECIRSSVSYWGVGISSLDAWSFISSWVVIVVLTSLPWASSLRKEELVRLLIKNVKREAPSMLNSLVILLADGMRDED